VKMTKTHFIIDVPLMALMLLQGISEIVLLVGSNDSTYIGIGGYEWKYVHEIIGIPIMILFTLHFIEYCKWFINETKDVFRIGLFDSV